MSGRYPFPRANRLRRSNEIRGVFRSGRRIRCGSLDLFLGPGEGPRARAAIVVPRYGRSAVERNRLKRRLREIVRLHWLPKAMALDMIVRARPQAYETGFTKLRADLIDCFERISC